MLLNLRHRCGSLKRRGRRLSSRCVRHRLRRMSPEHPSRQGLRRRNGRTPRHRRHKPGRRSRRGHRRRRRCGLHHRSRVHRELLKLPNHRHKPPPTRLLLKQTSPGRRSRNAPRRRAARTARVEKRKSRSRNSSERRGTRVSRDRVRRGTPGGHGDRPFLSRTAEARFLLYSRHRRDSGVAGMPERQDLPRCCNSCPREHRPAGAVARRWQRWSFAGSRKEKICHR